MEILVKRLDENAKLPVYGREVGPGIDLYSNAEIVLEPNARMLVPTGIAMAMPIGYVGFVWSHESSMVEGVVKVTRAMVDTGYREEIKVELYNSGSEAQSLAVGDKIAQLLIQKAHRPTLIEAEDLTSE